MAFVGKLKLVDDFNRSDEDPLTNGWSTETWLGNNSWVVSSNELKVDTATGGNSYGTTMPYANASVVYWDITVPGTADTYLFGRMTNWGSSTADGYAITFQTGYMQTKYYTNGSSTQIDGGTITGGSGTAGVLGNGDHVALNMDGNNIGAYVHDGTSWNLAFTTSESEDTQYPNAGEIGIYNSSGTVFTANAIYWTEPRVTWKDKGTGDATVANASLTPSYPSTVDADDFALLVVAKQSTHTVGTITDTGNTWTSHVTQDELRIYYRTCDGDEDGNSITVALSGGNSDDEAYAEIHTYSHPEGTISTDATTTTATNTGTSVSTGTLTPGQDDALIVHVVGAALDDAVTPSTFSSWAATDPSALTERTDTASH